MSVAINAALNEAVASRTLAAGATVTQTDANTTEKDLFSTVIPAGTLKGSRGIRLTAWGRTAANANTKTVRVRFGADVYTVIAGAVNGATWWTKLELLRRGPNSQVRIGQGGFAASISTAQSATAAENEDADITLRVTGQNGTAAAGDILFDGATVEVL